MKRIVTALLVAAETFAIATGTLAVIAFPVLLVWLFSFGLAGEPVAVFSLIGNLWFFGNGVPLSVSFTAAAAAALGLTPTAISATFSLIPLGFVLLTTFWASRVGKRLAASDWVTALTGAGSGMLTLGVLAGVLYVSIPQPTMLYPLAGAVSLPLLIFVVGLLIGFLTQSIRDDSPWLGWLRARTRLLVQPAQQWVVQGVTTGAWVALITLIALTSVTALVFALRLMTQYVSVITLSQQLQIDVLGTLIVFLATLVFLPTLLLWTLSWMIGPGFALGAGSSVSALSTQLGPIPSIPILGILPVGSHPWGLAFVSLIVLAAIAGTAIAMRRAHAAGVEPPELKTLAVMAVTATVGIFLTLALFFWMATGSLGPGRLEVVGPDPWLAAGIGATEVLFGVAVGAWLTRLDWNRIIDESRSRSATLTTTRFGAQVQRLTSRLRRRASAPAPRLADENAQVSATDHAADQSMTQSRPSTAAEQDTNDTVELSDFRPWWTDEDGKL